jgi:LEA14-like dessication related protein
MKKLILIFVIIIASLNFLYTFGYQGEPMSQLEFLSRTLGSIIVLIISLIQLMKYYNTKPLAYLLLSVLLFLISI